MSQILCYLTANHSSCIAVNEFYLLSSCIAEKNLILFVCRVSRVHFCKYFCFLSCKHFHVGLVTLTTVELCLFMLICTKFVQRFLILFYKHKLLGIFKTRNGIN